MPPPGGAHYDIMIRCESRNREKDALLTRWCILDSLAHRQAGNSRHSLDARSECAGARLLSIGARRAGFCRKKQRASGRLESRRPATHGETVSWFSTLTTPGVAHAARSAASFSAQDRTVPRRTTAPPSASTVMRFASTSALRRKASSIFRLISLGGIRGWSWMRLMTPLTPRR